MTVRVTTRRLDDDRALLDLVPPGAEDVVAWVRRGDGLVGWGVAARLEPGTGPGRFADADAMLADLAADAEVDDPVGLPGTGLVGVGTFAFEDDRAGSVLLVPRVVVGRHDGITWRTTVAPEGAGSVAPEGAGSVAPEGAGPAHPSGATSSPPRPRYAGSSLPDVRWLEAVAAAVDRIRAGGLEKVVLARDVRVWSDRPFDGLDLARRLAAHFPSCHTFVVDGLVGATPELLLRREGDRIASRVLAGTTGRADDEAEDAALGAALLASTKDRHEHQLAADSVTAVLTRRCGDLRVDDGPRLLRLENVQHLATRFAGHLDAPARVLDVVAELHPTAAVGGTPTPVAREVIRQLEHLDRGRYAAPVGWTDADGDGEWGIALRCAELDGTRARLFAGVGVVDASLPEDELEETRLKLLAMQAVLGDR